MKHRYFYWAAIVALTMLPLSAKVVLGQDHAAPAHASNDSTSVHGDESRPPLLSFDPGSAVWTIIVFLILMAVLGKFAWKPILAGLQQREKFISDSLESARRERVEAERLLKQYTEQIEKARVEATAIVEEGKRDAEVVRRRLHEETKKEADEMLARAKRDIGVARDDAVKQLYDRTLTLATDVAAKIVGRQLSPGDHRTLLDESIAEMAEVK